ncbi:MAG TPA: acyl-CoA dehydrogenase family protein, partial [Caulobacteraceae bacterium]|nr:acyl-CoA dehydrogenase family protein [Caulobacteraceae bacterium]
MADFPDDLETFRGEARAWLAEAFPPALAHTAGSTMGGAAPRDPGPDDELWRERMAANGWGAPTWPRACGGGGLSPPQARALAEEMARIGAFNPIGGMGVMMFGPTLLEYGSEEQKLRHLPPIARGELRWCQGFSEPGAGSDLAALQTRAEDRGDHWLVNGQKIWTSGANLADWCFCLVRTDPARKRDGISFLLIDMRSAGVETRPIKLISGASPFCETFFTDVRVAKENLVGPLNGGWTVGKRLLQYERQRSEDAPAQPDEGLPIEARAVERIGLDGAGR